MRHLRHAQHARMRVLVGRAGPWYATNVAMALLECARESDVNSSGIPHRTNTANG
jgi:hypothetical protein